MLWDEYDSPREKYGLRLTDAERLQAAARVKAQIGPSYVNGIRAYSSVFELLLFEGTPLLGGWQNREDNSFRGHRQADWVLTPNLARAPPDAERHVQDRHRNLVRPAVSEHPGQPHY